MKARGFTLVEVLVVMAILALLTAVALPNYTAYIQRSARSQARGQLLEAAQWVERQRTQFGRYDNPLAAGTQTLPLGLQCSPTNATGAGTCRDYTLSFLAVNVATFTLQAVPVAGGPMATDGCANFQVDQTGLRTHTGPATVEVCLGR